MVVKVTGAPGWVFPPELGGKEPLDPKGTALGEEGAGSWAPFLALGRDLGPSLWFSICLCPVCQLPACPGHLRAFGAEQPKPARLYGQDGGDGGTAGNPILPHSPGGFFGHGLAVLKPPQGREITSELS